MNRRGIFLAAGVGLLLVALAVGVESTTFRVNFPTDPLGPAAFPLLGAGLLALGAVALLIQGDVGREFDASDDIAEWRGEGRVVLAALVFAAYAAVLSLLGFVPATVLFFWGLARLFDGPAARSFWSGLLFSLGLFALFVWGLGLALPVWPGPWGG